jgi:small-conductance mechanosensitive channel/CRP-like cAMP-binding protein
MDVIARWLLAGLGVAVLVAALLVSKFAPSKRRHIRNVLVLLALVGVAHGVAWLAELAGHAQTAHYVRVVGSIFEAWGAIGLGTIFVFDLLLRAMRFEAPAIIVDLAVALTCLISGAVILHREGLTPPSVLAGGAVVSAVVALSMQTTLGNVVAGIALQLDGTIRVSDWIALENGKQGRVVEIRWRSTVLETRDGATLVVPNGALVGSQVLVLGRKDGAAGPARLWVWFRVASEHPPDKVVSLVEEALRLAPIPNVADHPPPSCVCMDLGAKDSPIDGAVGYAVRYWIRDLQSDDPTSSAVRARIHAALRRAGIPLATPTRAIRTAVEAELRADEAERRRTERRAAIDRVSLFADLTDAERSTLADALREAPFASGEVITKQGNTAHYLYILARGKADVRLCKDGLPGSERVATLTAPDFFGEMGLLTGEPRSADVVAASEVLCYRLEKRAVERLVRERPAIADALSKRAAERRMEMVAVRDHLDEAAKRAAAAREEGRILAELRTFFGLS